MAPRLDYDALRKQTLGSGNDEAVTVNTRALIDKVLARYSGEWTTLRELLQNAADASSKQVRITLETLPSAKIPVPQTADKSAQLRHVILHHTIKTTTVENDGEQFNSKDWARLKKIAEGNPDETKIGAFGVGFYSVFADSEEPFVSSGEEALAFYWKGDALFTKSLRLPEGEASKTTFVLPNRNKDSPVPNLLSLCRFLATSLTFVGLERIELWLDEWKLMTINKTSAPSADVQIPKEVSRKTREGLMHVDNVVREAAQLSAQWLRVVEWNPKSNQSNETSSSNNSGKGVQSSQSLRTFFHRLAPGVSNNAAVERQAKEEREAQQRISEDLMGISVATIFVHVNRATVKTTVTTTFSTELERATKKPPPKQTTISLLSASFDESEATETSSASRRIFESFVPSGGKGRIFIGFTTNQTTGLNVHISTPSVIPTVERESIDLVNRYIKTWNIELLRVAGIVSRVAWTGEMDSLQAKIQSTSRAAGRNKIIREDTTSALPEALFLHKCYSWSETTPSSEVGKLMEEAFWTCNSRNPINTISTRGVLPASKVRLEPDDLSFVEGIPVLPSSLASVGLVKKLIDYGIITEVTISDIKTELEGKALTLEQLKQFLEWLLQKVQIQEINVGIARSLLEVAVANDNEEGAPKLIVLGEMKNFLNPSRIPADMPVPSYVLPFKITKNINKPLLEIMFEDLQMVPWLRWLIENAGGRGELMLDQDVTRSPAFASTVFPVISKQWEGLSSSSKSTVTELLSTRTTMPTKLGMRRPGEAYFPSVKLFDDLPVVEGLHSVKDKLLAALGVRKTIEVRVIIDRLMVTSDTGSGQSPSATKWNHVDLIKYLTSVRSEIPAADLKFLRSSKLCPAETESLQPTKERYLISELYQPDQAIRRLGLPTLQWPGIFRPESAEGKFLSHLGLRSHPTYQDLVQIMATSGSEGNTTLRDRALKYFIDHHTTKGYANFDHSSVPLPYLPVQGSEKKLAAPGQVFVNEKAAILGFDILRRDLQVHALKFGVKQDPPIAICIERLVKAPPQTKRDAREMFAYMAGRSTDLSTQHSESLSSSAIVPVLAKTSGSSSEKSEKVGERIIHAQPRVCFLGHGDSKYADIFDYVDFGQEANSFLLRVGSKHEPSIGELAKRLVVEPARLFAILGDSRYLELLRSIADSWNVLKKDKPLVKDLRASRCLLAYKELSAKSSEAGEDEEGDSAVKSWTLAKANDIIVIDDLITYKEFRASLLAAPMEESLESFYHSLGAPEVSSLLEERQALGPLDRDQSPAEKLQTLLHERVRLFLHDFKRDEIKHDQNWIQKRLTVQCVHSITMTLSLKGYSLRRRLPKQAVISSESPTLYMTPRFDMLEVSRAMAPLLLHRVKPQSVFMLEMMLESSLNRLGRRGYNVQRILNEKAREARVAEEKRKQQEAEEQKQLEEREREWNLAQAAQAERLANQPQIPGDFPDSPEQQKALSSTHGEDSLTKPKGFLSGIGKRFNFDQMSRSLSQSAASIRSNNPRQIESPIPAPSDPPPPYSQTTPSKHPIKTPTSQPETVTAPHRVQENLLNLIQASRPHNSNDLASNPYYNDVKETATYCDAKPAHDLTYIGTSSTLRLFLDKSLPLPPDDFLALHAPALALFASILLDCADSYTLKRESMHIFYDETGSTIAFNSSKALFFNFRYFLNLHLPGLQQQQQQQEQAGEKGKGKARSEAVVYWSVVMAHELAHNVVVDHSSQHSYYTESLVMQYFGRIAAKALVHPGMITAGARESAAPGSAVRDPVREVNEVD